MGRGGSMNGTRPLTEDLETFLAVIDHGGIGAGARALGVPKSTVSRRVERLEAALGLRLLARSARLVRATAEGERVAERARQALSDLDALVAEARGGSAAPRGRLRASAPADLAAHADVWLGFMERYPEVAVQLEFTNRYVDVVREGFDLAVRGGKGSDESLVARRLGTYRLRAVASPEWAAANGRLSAPAELRQRRCVLLRPFGGAASADDVSRHHVVNQLHVAHQACLRGLGVAVLPADLVGADLAAGRLVSVLDAYDPLEVPLFAAYPDRRFLPAATVALLDWLAAAFA